MKSTFFAVVGLLCATLSVATPTATTPNAVHLKARTCGKNQFFWAKKSCCLDHGGPKKCPSPPKDKDCPKNWYWHPGQTCCVPKFPTPDDDKPSCGNHILPWWNFKSQCCEKNPPVSRPQVSPAAIANSAKNIWDQYKNNKNKWPRENPHVKKAKLSRTKSLCPSGYEACPISGLTGEFECVDPIEDIRACGGCPAFGKGQDCTAIPFAVHVGCSAASITEPTCVVTSCEEGYQPSTDGKSCVAL